MSTKFFWLMCIVSLGFAMPTHANGADDSFALHAGTVMPVSPDLPDAIEDAWIVVRHGRIVAVGADIEVPADLPVINLPRATVVPGLVAATANLAGAHRGDESIAAGYRAVDAFDRYGDFATVLANGVTTVHLDAGRHRLLTGQGCVVKLGGTPNQRVLVAAADLTVNLGAPKPPLDVTYSFPASADVAIPLPQRQRPTTRLAQFQALQIAMAAATKTVPTEPFSFHRDALAKALRDKLPFRFRAGSPADILGTIRFLQQSKKAGYIVSGVRADQVAGPLRKAKLPVVLEMNDRFAECGGDIGTAPESTIDETWDFAALHDIPLALAPGPNSAPSDLRLLAARAHRLGLPAAAALAAVTRNAAQVLRVADRVGSIAPGKDADLVLMTGSPLDVTNHVMRVYVHGQLAFEPPPQHRLVVRAGTIWKRPGQVIRDGEILVEDGKIIAVGPTVPHPPMARVIDAGPDAFVTPGLIDSVNHLGFGGDRTAVDTSMRLSKLFGAADVDELRVCRAGVTTAVVTPYAFSSMGSPVAAIKTAGKIRTQRVIQDPAAVVFDVSKTDPLAVGSTLAKPLAMGQKYVDAWSKYQKDLKEFLEKKAKGTATKPATPESKEVREVTQPDAITGVWEAQVTGTPIAEVVTLTMELQLLGVSVEGRIVRSSVGVTGSLSGTFDGKHLSAAVQFDSPDVPSPVQLAADVTAPDQFRGTVSAQGLSFPITAKRIDKRPVEIRVTRQRLRGKDGRPLPPKVNPALEPLKLLLEKKIPAVVKVSTAAQIREVLTALVDQRKLPIVLVDAADAAILADKLVEKKVAVVVPSRVISSRAHRPYLLADELMRRGVAIALQSNAADGARYLPTVAMYAVERGLDADSALAALTIDAARAFKIDNHVGSIEPGKDADLVIFNGHPFKDAGQVQTVVVNGQEIR